MSKGRTGPGLPVTRRTAVQLCGGGLAGTALASPAVASPALPAPCFSQSLPEGRLAIYALSPRAFRVCLTLDGTAAGNGFLLPGQTAAPIHRRETEGEIALDLPLIRCRIATNGAVRFLDAAGTLLLQEAPGSRRITPATVQDQATCSAEQGFVSPEDERLYGTGQFQDGFLNLRGLSRRLTQVNTQISLPFLLSSKGYGLLWHNASRIDLNPIDTVITPERVPFDGTATTVSVTTTVGTAAIKRSLAAFECRFDTAQSGRFAGLLDVGQPMASKYYVEIDGKAVVDFSNFWLPPTTSFFAELKKGSHTLRIVGDSKDAPSLRLAPVTDKTVLRSAAGRGIDYVVIAGPDPKEVIAEYRRLTGTAPLMPKWAYGYIHCRERYNASAEILSNAREFRTRNIPMDVIVQDWQYWGKYGWNAMRFDETGYPDPAGMIKELHALDTRFMLSVWSKADPQSEVGRVFTKKGCFVPDTTWIDFFNPAAAATYWGCMQHRLLPLGIDAWWQDATEPENDDLAGRKTAAGPGEMVRLQYPLEVTRTVYEGLRHDRPQNRAMILTRCAFLGQQRFAAATWSGDIGCDWETMKRQIPAGLNMMAAGYPYWTVDAGGFFRPGNAQYTDPAYHELLLRWLQLAVFLPLMRVHGYQSTTEPWHYGAGVEARYRAAIEQRYRLLPYIYSIAAEVTREGSSLLRPLVMDFPDDPLALDQVHSFMFGPSLHVAPVLAPGVERWKVYLPQKPGGWYDFRTGEHRSGGAHYDVAVTPDHIPVHAGAGAILPLGPVVQSTAQADGRDLAIHIYTGSDGNFALYDDDGSSYGYEKGAFSLIRCDWQDKARSFTLTARQGRYDGMLEQRTFTLVLHEPGKPQQTKTVTYRGKAVTLIF